MKLTAREDIETPIADAWAVVSDFAIFETAAMRRGAQVQRHDQDGRPGWRARFTFRGRERKVAVTVQRFDAPSDMVMAVTGKSVEGDIGIELVELGPRRTRITVTTEMRPRTLAARLFLQSLKLARGRITRRYQQGIAQFANMIETRGKGARAGF